MQLQSSRALKHRRLPIKHLSKAQEPCQHKELGTPSHSSDTEFRAVIIWQLFPLRDYEEELTEILSLPSFCVAHLRIFRASPLMGRPEEFQLPTAWTES